MYRVGRRKLASRKDLNKQFPNVIGHINPVGLSDSKTISSHGFTIMETMIFLAVSGALFTSALLLVSGQQAKTEFYQGVRDLNSQIQDVLNDISTGYYSSPSGGFTCLGGPTGPVVSTLVPINAQGTNDGCIFIGRVLAFGDNNDPAPTNTLNIFNVIGNRLTGTFPNETIVTNLIEAKPKALLGPEKVRLPSGLTVGKMVYEDATDGMTYKIGAFGFFSTLTQSYNGTLAGGQNVEVRAYRNTDWFSQTDVDVKAAIDTSTPASWISNVLTICFVSAGTNQHANIIIGGKGKLATKVEIAETKTC